MIIIEVINVEQLSIIEEMLKHYDPMVFWVDYLGRVSISALPIW